VGFHTDPHTTPRLDELSRACANTRIYTSHVMADDVMGGLQLI
jgi:hypothetical protein